MYVLICGLYLLSPGTKFFLIIIGIAIAVGLLLALREVYCWYLKINKQLELQKETNDLLRAILASLNGENPEESISAPEDDLNDPATMDALMDKLEKKEG